MFRATFFPRWAAALPFIAEPKAESSSEILGFLLKFLKFVCDDGKILSRLLATQQHHAEKYLPASVTGRIPEFTSSF
jgi:hypothetical protein